MRIKCKEHTWIKDVFKAMHYCDECAAVILDSELGNETIITPKKLDNYFNKGYLGYKFVWPSRNSTFWHTRLP